MLGCYVERQRKMYIMVERSADRHMDYGMNNAHAGVATLHSNLYNTAMNV